MNKQVKLRTFSISQDKFSGTVTVSDLLKEVLANSKSSNERRMRLSEDDPKKEEDLISHFNIEKENFIFATMLRIAPGDNVQHIDEALFNKANLSISDLLNAKLNTSAIYKDHYYFALSNNFLVTNLYSRTTITRLQTYLNWLLKELIDLSPVIEIKEEYDLASIKSFVIQDPQIKNKSHIDETQSDNSTILSRLKDLAFDQVKALFKDATDLQDVDLSQIVSAKLLIQLKNPTKKSPEEVKKAFSAVLKPVSDLDNISFKTRRGASVTGSQLEKSKMVEVDTTETGKLNEQTLLQQMEIFIKDLENEQK